MTRDQKRYAAPEDRFWAKVEKRGPNECWPWKASIGTWGYGSFYLNGGDINASRAAYLFAKGEPGSLSVLHRCDNPACCNPNHLFLGTQGDNVRDCAAKGRIRGHFTTDKPHPRYVAKLTHDLVKEARKLWSEGISQSEIARRFGVNSSTICNAVRRETWKNVP